MIPINCFMLHILLRIDSTPYFKAAILAKTACRMGPKSKFQKNITKNIPKNIHKNTTKMPPKRLQKSKFHQK